MHNERKINLAVAYNDVEESAGRHTGSVLVKDAPLSSACSIENPDDMVVEIARNSTGGKVMCNVHDGIWVTICQRVINASIVV
ncbi:MAG: hypothetical protein MUQ10_20185, partial [Anaerolineae bacterium]|nr:hypothetical protein [Anaerolineae bacterium]